MGTTYTPSGRWYAYGPTAVTTIRNEGFFIFVVSMVSERVFSASAKTRKSRTAMSSNMRPNESRSLIRSLGLKPKAAVPILGSTKWRVSLVRMADLLRMLGFHASRSSTTKSFFSALI